MLYLYGGDGKNGIILCEGGVFVVVGFLYPPPQMGYKSS